MRTAIFSAFIPPLSAAMAAGIVLQASGIGGASRAIEQAYRAHGAILPEHRPPFRSSMQGIDLSPHDHLLTALEGVKLFDFIEHGYIAGRRINTELGESVKSQSGSYVGPWRMAHHNGAALRISTVDSADKYTVDQFSAQRTLGPSKLMNNRNFPGGIYV